MRILPVLDLLNGEVVRGIGGLRQDYRPIRSQFVASSRPLAVADAFRAQLGLADLYLADLDAILGRTPDLATWSLLTEAGFRLWVDAGLRHAAEAAPLLATGIAGLVAGLETLAGPADLAEVVAQYRDRVMFSLDLRCGTPLGDRNAWGGAEAWEIAGRAVEMGVRRLLVLDLAHVGVGAGTGTEDLCARLVRGFPHLEVIAGGGIRQVDDLVRLRALGVTTVLLASALHDGSITRMSLEQLSRPN